MSLSVDKQQQISAGKSTSPWDRSTLQGIQTSTLLHELAIRFNPLKPAIQPESFDNKTTTGGPSAQATSQIKRSKNFGPLSATSSTPSTPSIPLRSQKRVTRSFMQHPVHFQRKSDKSSIQTQIGQAYIRSADLVQPATETNFKVVGISHKTKKGTPKSNKFSDKMDDNHISHASLARSRMLNVNKPLPTSPLIQDSLQFITGQASIIDTFGVVTADNSNPKQEAQEIQSRSSDSNLALQLRGQAQWSSLYYDLNHIIDILGLNAELESLDKDSEGSELATTFSSCNSDRGCEPLSSNSAWNQPTNLAKPSKGFYEARLQHQRRQRQILGQDLRMSLARSVPVVKESIISNKALDTRISNSNLGTVACPQNNSYGRLDRRTLAPVHARQRLQKKNLSKTQIRRKPLPITHRVSTEKRASEQSKFSESEPEEIKKHTFDVSNSRPTTW